jgi:Flp pilus assembly protein TadD
VELSKGKNWRCLAELAKAYAKTGRSAEAVQSAHQALDLAMQQHDEDGAKNLREALDRYARDGQKAMPQ